jgi:hypothetical protein
MKNTPEHELQRRRLMFDGFIMEEDTRSGLNSSLLGLIAALE